MGGTSVAFNVSATLLLCLIRGGFLQFFSWHACCIYVFVGWCRSFMRTEFLEKPCGVA